MEKIKGKRIVQKHMWKINQRRKRRMLTDARMDQQNILLGLTQTNGGIDFIFHAIKYLSDQSAHLDHFIALPKLDIKKAGQALCKLTRKNKESPARMIRISFIPSSTPLQVSLSIWYLALTEHSERRHLLFLADHNLGGIHRPAHRTAVRLSNSVCLGK